MIRQCDFVPTQYATAIFIRIVFQKTFKNFGLSKKNQNFTLFCLIREWEKIKKNATNRMTQGRFLLASKSTLALSISRIDCKNAKSFTTNEKKKNRAETDDDWNLGRAMYVRRHRLRIDRNTNCATQESSQNQNKYRSIFEVEVYRHDAVERSHDTLALRHQRQSTASNLLLFFFAKSKTNRTQISNEQ